jgi:hypothetical protein
MEIWIDEKRKHEIVDVRPYLPDFPRPFFCLAILFFLKQKIYEALAALFLW